MNKNILTVVGITILFLGLCITPTYAIDNVKKSSTPVSNGNTLYFGVIGEGNYTRIQDAIYDANDGDTIFVYDDSSPYYENVVVNKSISLVGEDKDTTIIDGEVWLVKTDSNGKVPRIRATINSLFHWFLERF